MADSDSPSQGPFPYLLIGIASFGFHLWLLLTLAPTPATFIPTRTIQGRYMVDPGTVNVNETTRVGKTSIFCVVGSLGPSYPCPSNFQGRNVVVTLAVYRHAFGTGEVARDIVADNGKRWRTDPDELVDEWWRRSWSNAFFGAMATLFVVGYLYSLLAKLAGKLATLWNRRG